MVQPKYSPEEALQRIKLMMEYDSSKTYTENKVIVENKQPIKEEFITAAGALTALSWWLIGGAAVGAGVATGLASEYSNASIDEKIMMAFGACDSATGDAAKTSMTNIEHAEITGMFEKAFNYQMFGAFGGGTDLELIGQALGMLKEKGRMGDFCKVREGFGPGTSFEIKLEDELNTNELTDVLNVINVLAAKSKAGSIPTRNEETAQLNWWIDNFPCLKNTNSFADPLVVNSDRYGDTFVGVTFKVKGEVKQFDMDYTGKIFIPNPSGQHTYTGKKVVCGTETKVQVVAESVKKKKISEQADLGDIDLSPVDVDLGGGGGGGTPAPDTTPVRTGYRSCSGSYSFGCKADAIATVQKCLGGLVADGKFGPKTQAALKAKGYESFTDAEVDKICGKDTEISGESPSDTDQNNLEF
jgi:hypothetical protein